MFFTRCTSFGHKRMSCTIVMIIRVAQQKCGKQCFKERSKSSFSTLKRDPHRACTTTLVLVGSKVFHFNYEGWLMRTVRDSSLALGPVPRGYASSSGYFDRKVLCSCPFGGPSKITSRPWDWVRYRTITEYRPVWDPEGIKWVEFSWRANLTRVL